MGGRLVRFILGLGATVCIVSCGMEGEDPNDDSGETRQARFANETVISRDDPNFQRFEMPEEEGECQLARECVPAGCSAEVCTTTSMASEVFTYCSEKHPGRQYYCTCLESRCRWVEDDSFTE